MQELALELAMIGDARKERDTQVNALKLSLISYNPKYLPIVFPEWKLAEEAKKVEVEATEEDLRDTTGEWKFGQSVSPKEAENIMTQLLGNPSGVLQAADLDSVQNGGWI